MYFKMNVRTRKSNKFACQFIVKGDSILEVVDYATKYLVASELYIDNCFECNEAEISEFALVFTTKNETDNLNQAIKILKAYCDNIEKCKDCIFCSSDSALGCALNGDPTMWKLLEVRK